jgi:hypothetical protein
MKNILTKFGSMALIMVMLSFNFQVKAGVPGTFANPGPVPSSVIGLTTVYSATGKLTLSADGVGSVNASMNIRVNKPTATATVAKAILMSSSTQFSVATGCVTLAGTPITWDGSVVYSYFDNYYADVTSIVAPVINGFPAGISTLPITECSTMPDGEALLVVFNDATTFEKSIIIMFGGLDPGGDNFSMTLGAPIDPNAPGALMDMGLGIGYSYQGCSPQYSVITVNGTLLTSSAGGSDDSADPTPANGDLITVGGIGDSDANPPDPTAFDPCNPRQDDELYTLLPFITNTTTNITVNTNNPSYNDNIFLAYFVISGSAIVGQGVVLSQTTSSGPVGISHTVKAHAVDNIGNPVSGLTINFSVLSGPNAGTTGSSVSDVNGDATFSYTGSIVGVDNLQACFTPSTKAALICSNTLNYEWTTGSTNIPTMSQWGLILLALALLGVGTAYILRKKESDSIA